MDSKYYSLRTSKPFTGTIPDVVSVLDTEETEGAIFTTVRDVKKDSPEWSDALEQWMYVQGYVQEPEGGFVQSAEEARRLDDAYKPEYFEKWMDWDRHVKAWGAIKPHLRGQSFLDVGCGMGFALKQLQGSGYRVRGTEVSPWAIGFCAGLGIEVDRANATKLPYEDDSFDTVFSMFLLDDVPEKAIDESIRVAKMRAVHLVPDGEKWKEGRLTDGFRVMVYDKEQ